MRTKKKGVASRIGVGALLIVMALTNPSKQKLEAKFGDRYESSLNCIFFSVVSVIPPSGSPLRRNNEEKIKEHVGTW